MLKNDHDKFSHHDLLFKICLSTITTDLGVSNTLTRRATLRLQLKCKNLTLDRGKRALFQLLTDRQTYSYYIMGFSRKELYPPCWGYRDFWSYPPRFPVKFTVTPRNFPYFCIDRTRNPCFSSIFGLPPGIPTTFALPPGIFHWYPQQGCYNYFFWKGPLRI